jgi:hypothetical protein
MREIVHLQAGQCGNQIGAKVSTIVYFNFFYCVYSIFYSLNIYFWMLIQRSRKTFSHTFSASLRLFATLLHFIKNVNNNIIKNHIQVFYYILKCYSDWMSHQSWQTFRHLLRLIIKIGSSVGKCEYLAFQNLSDINISLWFFLSLFLN